jgi:hypothetical protein
MTGWLNRVSHAKANVVPQSAFSHPAGKIGLRAVGNTPEANRTGLKIDKMERKKVGRFGAIYRGTEKNATPLNRLVPRVAFSYFYLSAFLGIFCRGKCEYS